MTRWPWFDQVANPEIQFDGHLIRVYHRRLVVRVSSDGQSGGQWPSDQRSGDQNSRSGHLMKAALQGRLRSDDQMANHLSPGVGHLMASSSLERTCVRGQVGQVWSGC